MSSISSSDRSNHAEKLRKAREEYESREAENNKKRNAEIKHLQELHDENLHSISNEYENRLNAVKEKSRETLNENDFENNRKIENVRQTYRESLRNKLESKDNEISELRDTFDKSLKKEREISSTQRERLVNESRDEISRRDQRFAELTEESRLKSQSAVSDNSRKLREAHEQERNTLVKGHTQILDSQNRLRDEMKKAYDTKLRESDRMREIDNARWSERYKDTVVNKGLEYSENLATKQAIMQEDRENNRARYENTLAKKVDKIDELNHDFRDSVTARINSQVRSRDTQINGLKNQLNTEMAKNERLRGIERKNISDAYEQRLDLVEQQRDDAVIKMKDVNDTRIGKILDQNQRLLRGVERDAKIDLANTNTRHKEEKENLLNQHKDQLEQVSTTADSRVKKMQNLTFKNQEQMEKYYLDSLEVMKSNYADRLAAYQDKNKMDQVALNKSMSERFRNMESNLNSRLEQTVRTYEDKIAELKANQQQDMKRLENVYVQRDAEREKKTDLEKESIKMKYEAKLAQLNESHNEQVDRLTRRHQEDMQNLAVKMSSYSRKA